MQSSAIVVVNMANQSYENYLIGLPVGGRWHVRFNSDSSLYSEDFANHPSLPVETEEAEADGLAFRGEVSIGAYTAVILSQDKT